MSVILLFADLVQKRCEEQILSNRPRVEPFKSLPPLGMESGAAPSARELLDLEALQSELFQAQVSLEVGQR